MEKRISRRELGKAALIGAAAISPVAALSKISQQPQDEVAVLESKLAAPFSDEAKKIATAGIASVHSAAARRWRHKLPENSEPCTIYQAVPVKRK